MPFPAFVVGYRDEGDMQIFGEGEGAHATKIALANISLTLKKGNSRIAVILKKTLQNLLAKKHFLKISRNFRQLLL